MSEKNIKKIGIKQDTGEYAYVDIGVDANNVDIDETTKLMDKLAEIDTKANKSIYGDDAISLGRNWVSVVGRNSFALGESVIASGRNCHAEGLSTIASGENCHAEGLSTTANGENCHAEGAGTTASGNISHAEGLGTTASGYCSHAENLGTIANGEYQHVQGKYNVEDIEDKYAHIVGGGDDEDNRKNIHTLDWNGNADYAGDVVAHDASGNAVSLLSHNHDDYAQRSIYGDTAISLGRKDSTTVGKNSVAIGIKTTASGGNSFAIGSFTQASGYSSFASGNSSVASGDCSFAIGEVTNASGTNSVAIGYHTNASGGHSVAIGYYAEAPAIASFSVGRNTKTSGDYSHACGYYAEALQQQFAIGHHNDTTLATENTTSGTTSGTVFVIGNGTSSTKSNAFRVTSEGKAIGKSAFASTGADYAEYFEWQDGNTNNEDRVGYFVTFADGKFIKKANEGDYILGIVSGMPCVIGNNDECWRGQYEMDYFGRFIYEKQKYIDPETGEEKECTFYKVNPEYDPSKPYEHREQRPEWSAVGIVGVLSVRDDGTCEVNGYCKCSSDGIATACERGLDTFRVIERVTDNIVKVVIK